MPLPSYPFSKQGPAYALQVVGVLSAMLFAISCGYEVLFVNGLHVSQYFLVALLQISLATWAIVEFQLIAKVGVSLPFKRLKFVLWIQFLTVPVRHMWSLFFGLPILDRAAGSVGIPIETSLAFFAAYFFEFLVINRLLIQCFSSAEQERASELDQARQELSVKLKTALVASGVAHEINQPLSSILLNIHLARQEVEAQSFPSSAVLQVRLAQIADDSSRVVSTIEIMRNLLRNVQTEHSIFDLSTVVKTALLYQKRTFASSNVVLTSTGLNLVHHLLGDGGQLQMAVSNLLRNAVEAVGQGDIINPRLSVAISRARKTVTLKVADNGPGFSGNLLRNALLSTSKPDGSGLGLYLVRLAVENNGGSMHLGRSELLGGAEVTLVFPVPSVP